MLNPKLAEINEISEDGRGESRRSVPSFNNRNNTGGLWGGGWERVVIRRRREMAQLVNAPVDE